MDNPEDPDSANRIESISTEGAAANALETIAEREEAYGIEGFSANIDD